MSDKKDLSRRRPFNRCTRIKLNGDQCGNAAIRGGTVCRFHGGSAPQVRAKAQVRNLMAADKLMAALLKIALDERQPALTRLVAIRDGLDRAGLGARQTVDLDVQVGGKLSVYDQVVLDSTVPINGPKPPDWDDNGLDGPWEEFIRPRQPEIIDAEVVEDEEHERALDARSEATERARSKRRRKRLNPELPPSVERGLPSNQARAIEEVPRTRPKQPSSREDVTRGREAFLRERLADDQKPRRTQRSQR